VAGPRSEFDSVLAREKALNPGVYFLTGTDPERGQSTVYVGEAESIRDRIRGHLDKDFWNNIIFFISKDENLTKAHIRDSFSLRLLHRVRVIVVHILFSIHFAPHFELTLRMHHEIFEDRAVAV